MRGDYLRTNARTFRKNIERRELFESAGRRCIRLTTDDLFVRPAVFTARVKRILLDRGWQGWSRADGAHPASLETDFVRATAVHDNDNRK